MKNLFLALVAISVFSCKNQSKESFGKTETVLTTETQTSATTTEVVEQVKTPVELGKQIFEGKGTCATCHKVDAKLIGPSLKNIAKTYTDKKGNIVDFLKNDAKPIVDPTQYEIMKANFAITKAMSAEELTAIESYIYSVQ